jgi:hypothetical protein
MSYYRTPEHRKTFHIAYDEGLEQWKVIYEGTDVPYSVHMTKQEALEAGRDLAQSQQPSQLVIHKMDGSIQTEHTYEENPSPPAG